MELDMIITCMCQSCPGDFTDNMSLSATCQSFHVSNLEGVLVLEASRGFMYESPKTPRGLANLQ